MRRAYAVALALAVAGLGAPAGAADGDGSLDGRVALGIEGLSLAAVAPLVVYLEPADGAAPGRAPRSAVTMRQRDARFSPSFLVVTAGQALRMLNDDTIYHNVFSYSRPNDFDLGLYAAGEEPTLRLEYPGVVKVYCSIHESMNATILVTPTRWFDEVGADGRYRLRDVPPGRYRAVLWGERLPPTARPVRIGSGDAVRLDWTVGPTPAAAAQSPSAPGAPAP